MGDYSPEPPRRDLIRHYTFNYVEEGEILDLSPQKVDGSVLYGSVESTDGAVGVGGDLQDAEIDVGTVGTQSAFTLAFHVRIPEPLDQKPNANEFEYVTQADDNAFVIVEETQVVSFRVPGVDTSRLLSPELPTDEWVAVACMYDGETRYIYVDGDLVAEEDISGGDAVLGDVVIGEGVSVDRKGNLDLDDFRLYRTDLGEEDIKGLASMGMDHNSLNSFKQAWDNDGIPLRQDNLEFAGTLGEEKDQVKRQLDAIRQARHIDDAAGRQLDRIGQVGGIRRREGEPDNKYRARIKGTMAAGRSAGTFEEILNIAALVVDTSKERIEINVNYGSDPGEANVSIQGADLDQAKLDKDDVAEILEDAAVGGHKINVIREGGETFEIINDGMVNDADQGLTSDAITTGGTLVSDI